MGRVGAALLREGMVLASDVRTPDGRTILGTGSRLTDRTIRMFRVWGIESADVEGETDESLERAASARAETLRRAEGLVAHAEKKLGCKLGESTADGRVYLKREEECVAACCGAPVVVINGHYHEKLTPEKVDELLDGLK